MVKESWLLTSLSSEESALHRTGNKSSSCPHRAPVGSPSSVDEMGEGDQDGNPEGTEMLPGEGPTGPTGKEGRQHNDIFIT